MKKIILLLSTLLLLLHISNNTSAQTPKGQSILWKISRSDLKEPSYLFGTIHVICKEDYIWTKVMQHSFDACEQVCFEMDLDDPTIIMTIAASMVDHSGKELKDYFLEDDYKKVVAYVQDSLQMSISLLQKMKPVALYSLFVTSATTCLEPVSYENELLEKAIKAKKTVLGIEDANDQIALLDKIPVDTIVKELIAMIDEGKTTTDTYGDLLSAYKKQDLASISKLITDSSATSNYTYLFLDDRNEKWIPRMMDMMEQGSIFFAVGAGHLTGDKGILSLLIEQGYTVTPITEPSKYHLKQQK